MRAPNVKWIHIHANTISVFALIRRNTKCMGISNWKLGVKKFKLCANFSKLHDIDIFHIVQYANTFFTPMTSFANIHCGESEAA